MSGERRPVPVALNPDHDVLGIAHLIHPVERDHRVAMTRPWWDHTVANGRKGGRKSPLGEGSRASTPRSRCPARWPAYTADHHEVPNSLSNTNRYTE